jgi:hypothetical protein
MFGVDTNFKVLNILALSKRKFCLQIIISFSPIYVLIYYFDKEKFVNKNMFYFTVYNFIQKIWCKTTSSA